MKKRSSAFKIVAGALVAGALAAIAASVAATLFVAGPSRDTGLFIVPKASVPSGALPASVVHRIIRQSDSPNHVTFDLWVNYQGKQYHAHALRLHNATNWLWAIQGSRVVIMKLKAWASDNPGLSVQVLAIHDLPSKGYCNTVASQLLIGAEDDAGNLRQPNPLRQWVCHPAEAGLPPGDAGAVIDTCHVSTTARAWADSSIIQCGSNWYLSMSKYGGTWPRTPTLDGPVTGGKTGVVPLIPSNVYRQADARVSKTCYNVPIGTPCP